MWLSVETLLPVVKWALATTAALNLLIGVFLFSRRLKRWRFFQIKESLAEAHLPLLCAVAEGRVPQAEALAVWSRLNSKDQVKALEELLLKAARHGCQDASELLFALGFVESWARVAFGRRRARQIVAACREQADLPAGDSAYRKSFWRARIFSVPRAVAVANLGMLQPEWALVFAKAALEDPAPDVRIAALDALGRSRHPKALPILLEAAANGRAAKHDLPLLAVKAALQRFRLEDLSHFLPHLKDSDRRLQVAALEAVAAICRQAGPEAIALRTDLGELCDLVIERFAFDSSPELRGLAASVVGQFCSHPVDAVLAARLHDPNAAVRLEAVRACCSPHRARQIPDLAQRLSDSSWEVREAAAQSLLAIGEEGKRQMYEQFVASGDPYGCDEVAEQIQRHGLTEELMLELAVNPGRGSLAEAVCRKMIFLGKTSALTHAAQTMGEYAALEVLLTEAPTDDFLNVRAAANVPSAHGY